MNFFSFINFLVFINQLIVKFISDIKTIKGEKLTFITYVLKKPTICIKNKNRHQKNRIYNHSVPECVSHISENNLNCCDCYVFGCLGGLFWNSGFLLFKGISVLMRDLSFLISSAKNIVRIQPCIVKTFANSNWFSNNCNV